MDTQELNKILIESDITEGYAIRNGLIVLWENDYEIPESLQRFLQLDVND
jgi:hypothetical protein